MSHPAPYLRVLRKAMDASFNLEEIRLLTHDLGIDFEHLSGDTKLTRLQALITRLAQQGRLQALIELLQQERPHQEWPAIPPAAQQIADERAIIPDSERRQSLQDFIEKVTQLLLMEDIDQGKVRPVVKATLQSYVDSYFPRLEKNGLVTALRVLSNYKAAYLITVTGLDLSNEELSEINLSGANLAGANFSGCNLTKADLSRANLNNANLSESNLQDGSLTSARLEGASLYKATLFRASLSEAHLNHTKLTETNLQLAHFNRTSVRDSDFSRASMCGCDLSLARLIRVSLREADLSDYFQEKAIVFWSAEKDQYFGLAEFTKLKDARLREVDMTGARITAAQLRQASLYPGTILPNGLAYDPDRPIEEQVPE